MHADVNGRPVRGPVGTAPGGSAAGSGVFEVPLPRWVGAATALDRIDYHDCFMVDNVPPIQHMTAEQWAREVLEHAPFPLRRKLPRGWRALGLRHGSTRSSTCVLGWPIRINTADRVVVGARSRVGMPAELVFARHGQGWILATLVQHDNPIVSTLWAVMAERHRRVVRQLLRSAAERIATTQPLHHNSDASGRWACHGLAE
jgi:hypothetical protein